MNLIIHKKIIALYMLDEQIEIESLQRHNKERLAENSHSQEIQRQQEMEGSEEVTF